MTTGEAMYSMGASLIRASVFASLLVGHMHRACRISNEWPQLMQDLVSMTKLKLWPSEKWVTYIRGPFSSSYTFIFAKYSRMGYQIKGIVVVFEAGPSFEIACEGGSAGG